MKNLKLKPLAKAREAPLPDMTRHHRMLFYWLSRSSGDSAQEGGDLMGA